MTSVKGTVSNFKAREESIGQFKRTVWTFRVQEFDGGDLVKTTSVEMRGITFHGSIQDGDEVELDGGKKTGGTVDAKRVQNLKTGETVTVDEEIKRAARRYYLFFAGIVIAGAAVPIFTIRELRSLGPLLLAVGGGLVVVSLILPMIRSRRS